MIKSFFKIFFLFFPVLSFAQSSDYTLIINGEPVSIGLNQETNFKASNGNTYSILLKQNDTLTYQDEFVEFNYPKGFSVSKTKLDSNNALTQISIITQNGYVFLVQEYSTLGPSQIIDIMLNELTKERVNYGYIRKDQPVSLTLGDSAIVNGKKATLTYKGKENNYTVYADNQKDQGVLICTVDLASDFNEKDKQMVDLCLKTLKILKK